DVGGRIDEVTEDVACLRIGIAAHTTRQQPVQATGDDQQGHVEVHFHSHRRGQRVHVEEAHGVGQGVLDQHALGIAGEQLGVGGVAVVGQENGRLLVAEVDDEE